MCHEFIINEKQIENLGELAQALGGKNKVPLFDQAIEFDEKCCLCPVDVKKVAKDLGKKVVCDGVNIFFED